MLRSQPLHLPSPIRLRSRAVCALLLGAVEIAGAVSGAQQAPGPGLGLLEAVRLTLVRDPNIAINQSLVDSSRGALKIASGQFDPVVTSGTSRSSANAPVSEAAGQLTTLLDDTLGVS